MTSALNFPARASLIDGIDGRGLDGEGRAADDVVERTEAMLPPLKRIAGVLQVPVLYIVIKNGKIIVQILGNFQCKFRHFNQVFP